MNLKKQILIIVVGANGYIGKNVVKNCDINGYQTISVVRKKNEPFHKNFNSLNYNTPYFYSDDNLPNTLGIPEHLINLGLVGKKVIIINAAGFAHNKKNMNAHLAESQKKLIWGLLNDSSKIKSHLIHLSSIAARDYFKSSHQEYFLYGKLKFDLEQEIKKKFFAERFQIILRIPAVWGKNSPGSIKHLFTLLKYNLPIAVSGILVKRAYININSLLEILIKLSDIITQNKETKSVTFEVCDGNYILKDLVISISKVINKKPKLLYFPPFIIILFLSILKLKSLKNQIFNEVLIDNSKFLNFIAAHKND